MSIVAAAVVTAGGSLIVVSVPGGVPVVVGNVGVGVPPAQIVPVAAQVVVTRVVGVTAKDGIGRRAGKRVAAGGDDESLLILAVARGDLGDVPVVVIAVVDVVGGVAGAVEVEVVIVVAPRGLVVVSVPGGVPVVVRFSRVGVPPALVVPVARDVVVAGAVVLGGAVSDGDLEEVAVAVPAEPVGLVDAGLAVTREHGGVDGG
mmetsp:Transcript_4149/g.18814  ORF Transcript_4149/g.18814 Transcript_4149/m.18814 type:complete len:203 (-) Transcript_4149:212-820(-)